MSADAKSPFFDVFGLTLRAADRLREVRRELPGCPAIRGAADLTLERGAVRPPAIYVVARQERLEGPAEIASAAAIEIPVLSIDAIMCVSTAGAGRTGGAEGGGALAEARLPALRDAVAARLAGWRPEGRCGHVLRRIAGDWQDGGLGRGFLLWRDTYMLRARPRRIPSSAREDPI